MLNVFNYKDSSYKIYYFPNSPIEPPDRNDFVSNIIKENMKDIPKKGTEKLIKKGIKVGMRETISSGLKGAVAAKLITPQLAKGLGKKVAGPVIDVHGSSFWLFRFYRGMFPNASPTLLHSSPGAGEKNHLKVILIKSR